MKSVLLGNVTTIVMGTQVFFGEDRGPVQRILLASSLNNCIPVLSVPLTVFAGLYVGSLMIERGGLVSWSTLVMTLVLRDLIQRDPEVRSFYTGVNALPRELPKHPRPSLHMSSQPEVPVLTLLRIQHFITCGLIVDRIHSQFLHVLSVLREKQISSEFVAYLCGVPLRKASRSLVGN